MRSAEQRQNEGSAITNLKIDLTSIHPESQEIKLFFDKDNYETSTDKGAQDRQQKKIFSNTFLDFSIGEYVTISDGNPNLGSNPTATITDIGGRLGFIVARYFIKSKYAKKLRKALLDSTCIETIVDFGNIQVFPSVDVLTLIIILRKEQNIGNRNSNQIKIVNVKKWNDDNSVLLQHITQHYPTNSFEDDFIEIFSLSQSTLTEKAWDLTNPSNENIKQNIRLNSSPLGFKADFMRWTPKYPRCESCNLPMSSQVISGNSWNLRSTEKYTCNNCGATLAFPRYGDIPKIAETRTGRCSEWSMLFGAILTLYLFRLG